MKILGIKNCDKVKKTFKWCKDNSKEFSFHDFRVDGLTNQLLDSILQQHAIETLVNKRSTTWRTLTDEQKNNLEAEIILNNPTLIKRPVVEINEIYHIGFFPEKWS